MKRTILPIVMFLCIAATAQTTVSISNDPAASREDILKLFQVMQIREQMVQVMKQASLQTRAMVHEQLRKENPNITDEQLAKIDARSDQLINTVPIGDMLDDMVPVYQKHLTKADVDAMVSFYSSPTGKKILHEMPAMTAEGMRAMQPRLLKIMDETMKKAQDGDMPPAKKPAIPDSLKNSSPN
jgi:uncharacterized protein